MTINGVTTTNFSIEWYENFKAEWTESINRLKAANCNLSSILISPKNNGNGNNFKRLPDGTVVSTENGYKKGGIR